MLLLWNGTAHASPIQLLASAGFSRIPCLYNTHLRHLCAAGAWAWPQQVAAAAGAWAWPRQVAAAAGAWAWPRQVAAAAGAWAWPLTPKLTVPLPFLRMVPHLKTHSAIPIPQNDAAPKNSRTAWTSWNNTCGSP